MKSWKVPLKVQRGPRSSGLQVQPCTSLSPNSDSPVGDRGDNSSAARRQPELCDPATAGRIPRALGLAAPARQRGRGSLALAG